MVHLSTTSKDNNSSGGNESCGGDSNQEVLGAEESSNLGTAILSAVNNLMVC